ncbi:MAG: GTP cyclohydrolase I FolE, partial [Pseudomonadota bacterium]
MSITNTIQDLPQSPRAVATRPSREEAEAAVRTLLAWAGEDPQRDGLRHTP